MNAVSWGEYGAEADGDGVVRRLLVDRGGACWLHVLRTVDGQAWRLEADARLLPPPEAVADQILPVVRP